MRWIDPVPQAKGKILVIRGGAIGDFILTLPVLTALRERFPDVRLELLGYPRVTQLALAGGLVDEAQSIEARALASFFAKGAVLPNHLVDYFASFALILSFLYDPDRIFEENVARCSKAQFLAGPYRPDESGNLHATEVFLRPLKRLAIFDADPTPRLDLANGQLSCQTNVPSSLHSAERLDLAGEAPSWLAVHPGSGSEQKNWPEESWRRFLQEVGNWTSLRLLLVGGEAEGERLERLAALLPAARIQTARSKPLGELAWLLQDCDAYIGHDSGISHLAAALGVRSLVLWGDSKRQIWQPRNEQVQVLQWPDGLSALPVHEVVDWVGSVLLR
jgi:heptosyltransferase-2